MRPDQLESGRGRTRAYLRNGTCIRAQESLEGRFLGLGLVCSSHTPWEADLVTSKLVPCGTDWRCTTYIPQKGLQGSVT